MRAGFSVFRVVTDHNQNLTLWYGRSLQSFQGTVHRLDILFHDVSIYFSGLYVGMAREFLNDPYVYSVFEQMGGGRFGYRYVL